MRQSARQYSRNSHHSGRSMGVPEQAPVGWQRQEGACFTDGLLLSGVPYTSDQRLMPSSHRVIHSTSDVECGKNASAHPLPSTWPFGSKISTGASAERQSMQE